MCSQLSYVYNSNRKAEHRFSGLMFTSLNGKTKARLDSLGDASYIRWSGVQWWTESYEQLPISPINANSAPFEASQSSQFNKKAIIYLTADAEDELSELKEGQVYIIGGIVRALAVAHALAHPCRWITTATKYVKIVKAHEVFHLMQNLCQNKAQTQGIQTAKLPIGRYVTNMSSRKVLTVNQVCFKVV